MQQYEAQFLRRWPSNLLVNFQPEDMQVFYICYSFVRILIFLSSFISTISSKLDAVHF